VNKFKQKHLLRTLTTTAVERLIF